MVDVIAAVYDSVDRPADRHLHTKAFGKSDETGRLQGPFDWQSKVPAAVADATAFYGEGSWRVPGEDGGSSLVLELPPTLPVDGRLIDAVTDTPLVGWLWVGKAIGSQTPSPPAARQATDFSSHAGRAVAHRRYRSTRESATRGC